MSNYKIGSFWRSNQGFTLIELMVVVAIIAVLSVVAIALYSNAQKNARDAIRRSDVNNISQAYETNASNGQYLPLPSSGAFANAPGGIPKDPKGGDYYNVVALDKSGYKVCAALESYPGSMCNSSSTSCFCKGSSQSTIADTSPGNLSGSGADLGLGGSNLAHPLICDPNQSLDDGLVYYWKLNETTPPILVDSVSGLNGNLGSYQNAINCQSAGCISKLDNTSSSYILNTAPGFSGLNMTTNVTASAWVYVNPNNLTGNAWGQVLNRSSHFGYGFGISKNTSDAYFEWGIPPCDGANSSPGPPPIPSSYTSTGGFTISTLAWHLLTATQSSSTGKVRFYIDGVFKIEKPVASFCSDAAHNMTLIGGVNGSTDDLRIYNRPLTDAEVTSLYGNPPVYGCFP